MPTPRPTQISIGAVRRVPGMPVAAGTDALRGVRDGLAAAGTAVTPERMPARLDLAGLHIRLRDGAGAHEIAEAVRRAVDAAIAERLHREGTK